jgi:hypothetical protein
MEAIANELTVCRERTRAILDLFVEILRYTDQGKLTPGGQVILYCEHCDCTVGASVNRPDPIHHCGNVLEVALCHCCQEPATSTIEQEDPSVNYYAVLPVSTHRARVIRANVDPDQELKAIMAELGILESSVIRAGVA